MFIYIVLLLFMLWLLLIRNSAFYKSNVSRRLIFCILIIFLFVIYTFRSSNVGSDYSMYNSFFNISPEVLKLSNIEPAYRIFNSVANHYSNFLIVPFIIFTIFFIGMMWVAKTFKVNRFTFLSFFVISYLYLSSFNVMRQYSALGIIGIGIFVYFYFYNHYVLRYILFGLIILLASSFHSTAIFCILFIIFSKIYVTQRKVFITGILTSALFFTNIVRNLANYIFNYFPGYVSKYPLGLNGPHKGPIQFLPILIQFVFLYIYVKYNKTTDYKMRFILSGYLFFLFLYSGGGNLIMDRLQMYSYIFPLLFGCLFMDNNKLPVNDKNSLARYYKHIFVLFWVAYFIFRLMVNNAGVIPYNFL